MAQTKKLLCCGCGAALPVKANITRVKCEFCGTINVTDVDQKIGNDQLSCPNCGFINPDTAQFCGRCGKPLYHTCPKCGEKNHINITYCTKCGGDIERAIPETGTTKELSMDEVYADYLQDAQQLFKEFQRSYTPIGILCVLVIIGGMYLTLSGHMSIATYYVFLLVAFLLAMILSITTRKKMSNKARLIAQSKPGFDKFQKSYFRNKGWFGWPSTLKGKWRERFLSMIWGS